MSMQKETWSREDDEEGSNTHIHIHAHIHKTDRKNAWGMLAEM